MNKAELQQQLHHIKLPVVTRPIKVAIYCMERFVLPRRCIFYSQKETNISSLPNVLIVVKYFTLMWYSPQEYIIPVQLPWLVMELMYISLRGLIKKYEKNDFTFHFKLSILMDMCNGLEFLHSQSIIHRDLSSNNILLTKHLVAKISDLGMAKVIPPGLQKHTQAPGTVVFMPPEALSVNPQYGKPIDVFSVGVSVCM